MSLERPRPPDPYSLLPAVPSLTVRSDDFDAGGVLAEGQIFDGGNSSPHLEWQPGPSETGSYVVSCFDPDAPVVSGFWHWMVCDIPASVTELSRGAGLLGGRALPSGAFHSRNDFGTHDYSGAAPPPGDRPHRYFFAVHAVNAPSLGLTDTAPPALVGFKLASATLARGVVVGTFHGSKR